VLQATISIAVVAGIFIGLMPQIADYGDVWDTITDMTLLEVATLLAVGLWNLVTYWFVLTAALPGLRFREAAVVNQASTAVSNTLPAGGALGVGVTVTMLSSWGFRGPAIGLQALVSGIWNNFVKLGMPIAALVLLALEGEVTGARLVAAALGIAVLVAAIVVFALLLNSDPLARAVGRRVGRVVDATRRLFRAEPIGDFADRASRFRSGTIELLRRRWIRLTVSTLVSHVSLYVVLLIALRHVGVGQKELSWIAVLAAFAFVRLISALPITPGGVGVVELGYAAVLTLGTSDLVSAQVVAAILLFRAITYFLPIPLGAISYVAWRLNHSWRLSAERRDQLAGVGSASTLG
jgi:uncharacterized protein (TIRG00374 family)